MPRPTSLTELRALRQERNDLADEARLLIPAPGLEWRESKKKLFEDLHRQIDSLNAKIQQVELDSELYAETISRSHRREAQIEDPNGPSPRANQPAADSWIDPKTGKKVRVLTPGQSFRAATHGHAESAQDERVGFGAYIRALAMGPQSESEKRVLAEGVLGTGGYMVPTPLSAEVIDHLRARTVCMRAGARTVVMPSATFTMARVASDPVAAWKAENAQLTTNDPTFEAVIFKAQALGTLVIVSRELLEDATGSLDGRLLEIFAKVMALEVDRVALVGSGTPPQPKGIINVSGIGSVVLGSGNGASLADYNPIIDARQALLGANALDPTAAIMNPRTDTSFAKLQDTLHQPLRRPDAIKDLPFFTTTQIPITDTVGTSTNCSKIFVGDFTKLMFGIRTQLEILVLRERWADYGQVGFMAWMRADVQVEHPESFAAVSAITP